MRTYTQLLNKSDRLEHGVSEVLAQGETAFQEYIFFKSPDHGVCIALDGDVQSCEADEGIYHEALVHPAMLAHPNPQSVLIMGGGEGATAREVLAHDSVKKVVMIDIDEEFVTLCKTYVKSWGESAFSDPRLEVLYMDINEYLAKTTEKFDVVIGDLIDVDDWESDVASLYSQDLYTRLKRVLNAKAIVATQGGALGVRESLNHKHIRQKMGSVFRDVKSYGVVIPSFYHLWGFLIAGDDLSFMEHSFGERFRERAEGLEMRALGIEALIASFSLPLKITNTLQ